MKTKRKRGLVVALALLVTTALSACSSNGDTNVTTEGSSGTGNSADTKVTFSIGYATGDPAGKQAISEKIKAFMEANPNIVIKDISEGTSSSYLDWLKTKDAVGEFPDLVEMRDTEVFLKAGKIAELPQEVQDLFDSVPAIDGKVYNAPMGLNAPEGIIYSKKAYQEAGITELPKTYDDFLADQEKLKASGITPIVVGGKDIFHMGFWLNKFLIDQVYANDPDWNAKRTAKQVSFTDDNVVQAMSDYKELFQNYVDKGWLSTGDNQTTSILISGKAAQLYSGPWMFTQIEEADPNFEFGFYALPDRQGNINVVGLPSPAGWSLSSEAAKDEAKKEAMVAFLKFFFDKEQYGGFLSATNTIPSTKDKPELQVSEQMQTVLDLAEDSSVKKSLMINQWYGENQIPSQFRNWYYKLMQDLVVSNADVKDYMQKADAEYDSNVASNQQ